MEWIRSRRTSETASSSLIDMDSGKTIFELKSAFIRSQVRILSESLDLPKDWRNYAPESDEGDLTDKVIEDVVHKGSNANHKSDSAF